RQTRNRGQLIGVERCVWGNSYEGLVALADPALGEQTPRASERIVDPKAIVQSGNVYQTLRQAVEAANPGDTILIKHNGSVKIDSVRFEKPDLDLTIRPHTDYQPVLSIGETTESDAALFRIYDGRLTLDHLQFYLRRPPAKFKAQSVVAVM